MPSSSPVEDFPASLCRFLCVEGPDAWTSVGLPGGLRVFSWTILRGTTGAPEGIFWEGSTRCRDPDYVDAPVSKGVVRGTWRTCCSLGNLPEGRLQGSPEPPRVGDKAYEAQGVPWDTERRPFDVTSHTWRHLRPEKEGCSNPTPVPLLEARPRDSRKHTHLRPSHATATSRHGFSWGRRPGGGVPWTRRVALYRRLQDGSNSKATPIR
eukprot:scaffold1372_cov351-Pavlova_lutheri.AAC.2